MRFNTYDAIAIEAGRYQRATQFQVIDPEFTLFSYQPLIRMALNNLPFLNQAEEGFIRIMLHSVLDYMMCLPASSTHHHRTAGGLFYHSLETAALAVECCKTGYSPVNPTEDVQIMAFIAGLLHDFGKVVTLFSVHPFAETDQNAGFGQLNDPEQDLPAWCPYQESLWDWTQRNSIQNLSLRYRRDNIPGHEAALRNGYWKTCVPEELLYFLNCRNPEAEDQLTNHMERVTVSDKLLKVVKEADKLSMRRDVDPLYRTSPKRSDLHVARRFNEFAALSAWNNPHSPFVMADIWLNGRDLDLRLPMFRASWQFFRAFREYLLTEDRYGAAFRDDADDLFISDTLEVLGVLSRSLPGVATTPGDRPYLATFSGVLDFPHHANQDPGFEKLSFYPHGEMMGWLRVPPVRVLL